MLQAVRNYEKELQQGIKDPLIFGMKKLFQNSYRELEHFLINCSIPEQQKNELNDLFIESRTYTELDELLDFLITKFQNYLGESNA